MKKIFLIIIVLSLAVSGQTIKTVVQNWNGWLDTCSITDTLDSASVKYGAAFKLTDGENMRMICLVNDTATAGLGADSVNFTWGYQVGDILLNGSNAKDTAWDDRVIIDTMCVDSFGVSRAGTQGPNLVVTRYYKGVDTTYISGFAYQSRLVVPEWGILIRPWVMSNGEANAKGKPLKLRFAIIRRLYSQTRNK